MKFQSIVALLDSGNMLLARENKPSASDGAADRLVFLRGEGVCLCPIRVSAVKRLGRGGKWRLVTHRCVILEKALEFV